MSENKRREERKNLVFFLRIYLQGSDDLIGFLIDLTTNGFHMLSEHPLEKDKEYHLVVSSPEAMNETWTLKFSARMMWVKDDNQPGYFRYGFKMEKIDPVSHSIIQHLIEHYGFTRNQ